MTETLLPTLATPTRELSSSTSKEAPLIAISITHGFQARNLLQTDVAPTLLADGYRLHIISPAADSPDFRERFGDPRVSFGQAAARPTRLSTFFAQARRYALANPRRNATYNLFNEEYLTSRKAQYVVLRLLNRVLGRSQTLRAGWMKLEGSLISGRRFDRMLRDVRPALLVTGTPGTDPLDALLLRSAKRLGIPTVCVVLSWDNLTSKGYMAARPDRLIVWNDRMRSEAIELHDYSPRDVNVVGVAHFDVYQRPETHLDRGAVCARLGLDRARPYIVFGTVSPFLFRYNVEVAEVLARAVAESRIPQRPQIVVRVHPQAAGGGTYGESLEAYRTLAARYPGIVALDIPDVAMNDLQWSLPTDEMLWLASLLRHAGVCVNVASTLAIDAALADTPVASVAFDGTETLPYRRSIRRAYDYTHYRPIVETGGAPVAETPEALFALIDAYLRDRSLNADGRQRIAHEQAARLDGRSGVRVARALVSAAAMLRHPIV